MRHVVRSAGGIAVAATAIVLTLATAAAMRFAPPRHLAASPVQNPPRTGAWVDTVRVVEEPNPDAAIAHLSSGDLDVYAYTVSSPGTFEKVVSDSNLGYAPFFGSSVELTLNPVACTDRARLNPFASRGVREAMNRLVDRDYVVAELLGGLGSPRYTPVAVTAADRGRMALAIRALEVEYAYDPDAAERVVRTEMQRLGATRPDERWLFRGRPVEIIGLIRTEDERRQIGDYFASQLERIGFAVVREYKTSAEAAAIWQMEDPSQCGFGFYTGGWVSSSIERDSGANFDFYYTPRGLSRPLWQAYTPSEAFSDAARRLAEHEFATLAERRDLFASALRYALEDSARIWIADREGISPHRADIEVAADLVGGIRGSSAWSHTLRRRDAEGGQVTWAAPSILTEPWNPVGGTNWQYDVPLIGATGERAFLRDPYNGLPRPSRVASCAVTAAQGLPIEKTFDRVRLDFAPRIVVPGDAWVDWDASTERFVTAAETHPAGRTANVRTVVTYPRDVFSSVTWHDGSPLSLGDMILSLIMTFDPAKPDSAIYDEAQEPALEAFLQTFRGIRIASTDPLTVEYYTDAATLDAESALGDINALWPAYGYGEGAWHAVALGVMAEAHGLAAFSPDKSTMRGIDQLDYIAGPTLTTLSDMARVAAASNYLPYAPTMRAYVPPDEIAARYANLARWYARSGHYWIGTGPLALQSADRVLGTAFLARNAAYADPADRWADLAAPPAPRVLVDGPHDIVPGVAASFAVEVTVGDEPYPTGDLRSVEYLVFDAAGTLAATGAARPIADGQWSIDLPADVTARLRPPSCRVEAIVASKRITIPAVGSQSCVVEGETVWRLLAPFAARAD